MEKKYQVFISSTYTDLKKERKKAQEIMLAADCIPAGMEAFVASNAEQFDVIKKVIALCDYYVLIIGGRYGSINKETGLSYTEMEYEYAVSIGMPILVFAIDDSVHLSQKKKETEEDKIKKLRSFKKRALANRLASVWKTEADLVGQIAVAIMKAKQDIERPGWVRGEYESGINKLLKQIADLQAENATLKKQHEEIEKTKEYKGIFVDEMNKTETLHFTEIVLMLTSSTTIDHKSITLTVREIFKSISIRFTGNIAQDKFVELFSCLCPGYYVNSQEALKLLRLFSFLGLIGSTITDNGQELFFLTQMGKEYMNRYNFGGGTD